MQQMCVSARTKSRTSDTVNRQCAAGDCERGTWLAKYPTPCLPSLRSLSSNQL